MRLYLGAGGSYIRTWFTSYFLQEVVIVNPALGVQELVLDVLQEVRTLVRAPLCVLELSLLL